MKKSTTARVLLVDRETAFIELFADRIRDESDMDVVGVVADCNSARQILAQSGPDVMVLDVGLTDPSAFELARDAADLNYETRILFLATSISEVLIEEAARSRMSGFMTKSESVDGMIAAIRNVARGGAYHSPEIAERLERRDGAARPLSVLTNRQIQVLRHLAKGASVKEVAESMQLSEKSIDSHKYRIMRRLGIHDRVKLALFAVREGLVLP